MSNDADASSDLPLPCGGEPCRRQLLRWARRLTHDPDEAEDLRQEVCCRCLTHAASFHGQAKRSTWLYRILLNCYRDLCRQHYRRSEVSLPETRSLRAVRKTLSLWEPIDRWMQREADRQLIRMLFRKITPHQRQLLLLRYGQGCSCREIARRLDIREESVTVALHRARQALRRCLQALLDQDGTIESR
ncbi:MAG: RNA polymerase sigma factor [Armatimonadetes bacterium]|nr:RNA polymerase sigma factor [Armatimonadota bacterium]